MNILVCVKQVPDTTEIKIDPVKNTLIRDGVPSILNPFDGYALEAAARIKDKNPDAKLVVVSMGPPQAVAVLKECLAIAADKINQKGYSPAVMMDQEKCIGCAFCATMCPDCIITVEK